MSKWVLLKNAALDSLVLYTVTGYTYPNNFTCKYSTYKIIHPRWFDNIESKLIYCRFFDAAQQKIYV